MEKSTTTTDVLLRDKLQQEKLFFLKNQLWASTISASFSRAYVYRKEVGINRDKDEFKNEMFRFIDNLVNQCYINSLVNDEMHISHIYDIQEWSKKYKCLFNNKDKDGNEIKLNDRMLSFGICQKLLNLYLKYLWCANLLNFAPPHFPLDRLIQQQLPHKKDLINWTELTDSDTYTKQLNRLKPESDKAIWELLHYNKILNNG